MNIGQNNEMKGKKKMKNETESTCDRCHQTYWQRTAGHDGLCPMCAAKESQPMTEHAALLAVAEARGASGPAECQQAAQRSERPAMTAAEHNAFPQGRWTTQGAAQ